MANGLTYANIYLMNSLFLRLAASILLGIWLILMLIGKSGMIHVLLIAGIAFAFVEIICVYRKNLESI